MLFCLSIAVSIVLMRMLMMLMMLVIISLASILWCSISSQIGVAKQQAAIE
jgi:hypothetical protein